MTASPHSLCFGIISAGFSVYPKSRGRLIFLPPPRIGPSRPQQRWKILGKTTSGLQPRIVRRPSMNHLERGNAGGVFETAKPANFDCDLLSSIIFSCSQRHRYAHKLWCSNFSKKLMPHRCAFFRSSADSMAVQRSSKSLFGRNAANITTKSETVEHEL